MLAAGGSAGALCAWPTADWLGRKWSVFMWGLVFLVGAAMQMIANYDALLAGRFIGGMGVGASSMLSPQFLAENSPKSVRGSMTATYNLMIVMSLALAFWVNYGVSLWNDSSNAQWRTAMGIQLIPGALMCMMIPFIPETPRYLINHGKSEQGLRNLTRLRKLPADHFYIQAEYQEIEAQVKYEQEAGGSQKADEQLTLTSITGSSRAQLLGHCAGHLCESQQLPAILPRRHAVSVP